MVQEQVSAELLNILTKTVVHQAQRVKALWYYIRLNPTDNVLYQSFEQAVHFYANVAKQFNDATHTPIAEHLEALCISTESGEKNTQDIAKLIKSLESVGLRESDLKAKGQYKGKKIQFFFAGKSDKNNQELMYKLSQFNIYCTWVGLKEIHNSELTTGSSIFLFDCSLVENENFLALLQTRAQAKNQVNLALYQQDFPSAKVRTQVLHAKADLLDSYDFPSLVRTLQQKSHLRAESDITLFLLLDETAHSTSNIQNYLELSEFNLHKFTDIKRLLDELNEQSVDAIIVTPEAACHNSLPISLVIKQQSTQAHVPVIYIHNESLHKAQISLINTCIDDRCDTGLFKESLLKHIEQSVVLKNLISQDRLTGLYTHSFFLNKIKLQLKKSADTEMTLVMLDIDHFKKVNDKYGHQVGDYVIQNLSLYLKQNLRYDDPIGRYGGEEFAVLLNVDENQAFNIMDKIRKGFSEFEHSHSQKFKVSFSCGLAPWRGQSVKKLVKCADKALYQAKKNGRNCCVIYTDEA